MADSTRLALLSPCHGYNPMNYRLAIVACLCLFLLPRTSLATTWGIGLSVPHGGGFVGAGSASFTIAVPEIQPRVEWNTGKVRFRNALYLAPRYDAAAEHFGNDWTLDAGIRAAEVFIDLDLGGILGGIGPYFALDVGMRTDFRDVRLQIRPEVALSLDDLVSLGLRYGFVVERDIHSIESVVMFDVAAIIRLMSPINEEEEFNEEDEFARAIHGQGT